MGYWENTTYIRHDRVADVAGALDRVFAREGMAPVPVPAQRARLAVEPMQYDGALDNDLWAFALFPGADGWSVLKSAPLEVLSERAQGAGRMRLVDVCRELEATAFQVNVYDSSGTVLVEVSSDGEVLMSGFSGLGDDPMRWNGIEITEERAEPAFELHDLGHLLSGDMLGDDFAQAAASEIGGRNAAYCSNLVSVDTLISHKPLNAPGGVALCYQWSGQSRQRRLPSDTFEQYGVRSG